MCSVYDYQPISAGLTMARVVRSCHTYSFTNLDNIVLDISAVKTRERFASVR